MLSAGGRPGPQREAALEDLCRAYWYPLFADARRRGRGPEEAEDDVQGFFARLLEKDSLAVADPDRGRFRSFLLTAFRNYQANEAERASAAKRGGGRRLLSIESASAEERFRLDPGHEETPERVFLRDWAMTILRGVLERLRARYVEREQDALFEALKQGLTGIRGAGRPYREIADELGMTESAVRVASHRLRGRYRQALRDEVAQTLEDPAEVEEELAALFDALAGR